MPDGADSAILKIDRAAKHITELAEFLRDHKAFAYVLEKNMMTGERATFARKDEVVAAKAAVMIGDIVFNLRSALDHAYWKMVSPHVAVNQQHKIQFPFVKKRENLESKLTERGANNVSINFADAIRTLRPYHENGNELLCLIDKLCVLDKHKLLIPTGDYTEITADILKKYAPCIPIPPGYKLEVSRNARDIVWREPALSRRIRRAKGLSATIEEELDVPVQIVFAIDDHGSTRKVVPTLNMLVDITRNTITTLRASV